MSLYIALADKLQYLFPAFYKERFFKKVKNLNRENVLERNIEPELVWINDFLHRKSVFIDIGANVGTYLFQVQNKLNHQNIYAFEPNKKLYKRLIRIFPNMLIFPLALSDENTSADFKIPVIKGKKINSRGTLQTGFKEIGEKDAVTKTVKVVKLDDWAAIDNFTRIDLIKIDVEGNEMKTLGGAKKTICKFKPALMVEMEQRHHSEPIWNLISQIKSWGYEAHYLDRKDFTLKILSENFINIQNAEHLEHKETYVNNIIFIPKQTE